MEGFDGCRWLWAPALIALTVVLPARRVAGAAADRLALAVHLDNRAAVPDGELASSRAVVTDVFRAAGVDIQWFDGPVPKSDERQTSGRGPRRIGVMLVNVEEATGGTTIGVSGCNLGLAVPARGSAYLFYNRVVHAARARPVDIGVVLGRVIAHEIGHVLMPPGQHSTFGIMRRDVDFSYENPNRFTDGEVTKIRATLRTWDSK